MGAKPAVSKTLIRLVQTIEALPLGQQRTTMQVSAFLKKRGHNVTRRTVERNLQGLVNEGWVQMERIENSVMKLYFRRIRRMEWESDSTTSGSVPAGIPPKSEAQKFDDDIPF